MRLVDSGLRRCREKIHAETRRRGGRQPLRQGFGGRECQSSEAAEQRRRKARYLFRGRCSLCLRGRISSLSLGDLASWRLIVRVSACPFLRKQAAVLDSRVFPGQPCAPRAEEEPVPSPLRSVNVVAQGEGVTRNPASTPKNQRAGTHSRCGRSLQQAVESLQRRWEVGHRYCRCSGLRGQGMDEIKEKTQREQCQKRRERQVDARPRARMDPFVVDFPCGLGKT